MHSFRETALGPLLKHQTVCYSDTSNRKKKKNDLFHDDDNDTKGIDYSGRYT